MMNEIMDQIFNYSQYSNIDISFRVNSSFWTSFRLFSKNNNVLVYPTGIINISILFTCW